MKFYLAGLAALVAVLIWLRSVSVDITARYAEGVTTVSSFLDAYAVPKMAMLICLMMMTGAVVLTGIGALIAARAKGRPGRDVEFILLLTAAAATGMGLLGGGYGELNTRIAMVESNTTNFAVTAPARLESLLNVEIGLFAGIVALAGAALVHFIAGRKKLTAI